MTVLVTGSQRVDAGKTTFATGLVAHTGATGYKPRAGNDHWFDHDDVRTAVDDGRLYGKDAARLAATNRDDRPAEAINPIHRLWRPSPGPESGLLGKTDREFVLDRAGDHYVLNGTVEVPDRIREALPLEDAQTVHALGALNDAMQRLHVPALRALGDEIAACEAAVVESYSDVAMPLQSFEPDVVAVVEPGRVRTYHGDRWTKACAVAPGGHRDGQLEERVDAVTDLVDPIETRPLEPLPDDTRMDPGAVADAYAGVYDRLLAIPA